MAQASLADLDLVLTTMVKTIVDNADRFAHLDSIVADGDFGTGRRPR
jgi:phosphoenolpyruvate---glycerone phosphotransferase subunit DhaL